MKPRRSKHSPQRPAGAEPTIAYVIAAPAAVRRAVESLGGYDAMLGPEAHRARTLRVAEDAEAFLASRALLRMLVAFRREGSPAAAASVEITRHCVDCGDSDHGKPRTADFAVSLSRTREMVMAAVAPHPGRLGVDIERSEKLSAPGVFEGFDDMVLTPAERLLVSASAHPDRLRLAAWSGKEALLKATGDGLRIEPHTVPVIDSAGVSNGAPGLWHPVAVPGAGTGAPMHLCWVDAGELHVASVAADAPLGLYPVSQANLGLVPE